MLEKHVRHVFIPIYTEDGTVEPLNNRHIEMDHFVHYRKVVQEEKICCQVGALESVLYSKCVLSEVPLYYVTIYRQWTTTVCNCTILQ